MAEGSLYDGLLFSPPVSFIMLGQIRTLFPGSFSFCFLCFSLSLFRFFSIPECTGIETKERGECIKKTW